MLEVRVNKMQKFEEKNNANIFSRILRTKRFANVFIHENHSVNSNIHSVNGDIAINIRPLAFIAYDKLCPIDNEHVSNNLCKSGRRERLDKYVKYKDLSFLFTMGRHMRNHAWGPTDG